MGTNVRVLEMHGGFVPPHASPLGKVAITRIERGVRLVGHVGSDRVEEL